MINRYRLTVSSKRYLFDGQPYTHDSTPQSKRSPSLVAGLEFVRHLQGQLRKAQIIAWHAVPGGRHIVLPQGF